MSATFAMIDKMMARNEPVRTYGPGSSERASLMATLQTMKNERISLPIVIGGRSIETGIIEKAIMPHDHAHILADAHLAGHVEVGLAIASARTAWHDWSRTSWEERARIFLKAADLVSGPWRLRLNAATMLGQSKTIHQAEIDAAAEFADFLRFNVQYMLHLYSEQPISAEGEWNRVDYRPLEGFVYAATPFTAIAGNLPTAPALMGNTVVWKPSATAKYAAHFVMALLQEAGLPPGVINLVYGDAAAVSDQILANPDLAGVHFTGSTTIFDRILHKVANTRYRNYPRVVGETGGKNFTLAHASADAATLTTAIIRGGYEYQGQKCSATSRVYIPRSLFADVRDRLVADIDSINLGDVSDPTTFMGAVIDERAWRRLAAARNAAAVSTTETIIAGQVPNQSHGYFIPPTLIETTDACSRFMAEEFFGPIVSVFVYEDDQWNETLTRIDADSVYGLTGAVFARDATAVGTALDRLRYAAGNFYVNDKSTGAVVGQQPFGGARSSGTNDKAGSMWNLARWVSPRTIKENFLAPTDYRYPSMQPDADRSV